MSNKTSGGNLFRRAFRAPMRFLRRVTRSLFRDSIDELRAEMDRDAKRWSEKNLKQMDKMLEERTQRQQQGMEEMIRHLDERIAQAETAVDFEKWKKELMPQTGHPAPQIHCFGKC